MAALGFAVTAVARAGVFAATDLAAVPRAAFGAVRAVALPGLPPALGRAFAARLLAVPPLRVGLAGVDGAWVDRAGADRAGADRAGADRAGADRAGAAARLAGALAGVARLVAGLPVPRGLAAARGVLVAAVLDAGALVAGALVAGAALGVLAGAAAPRAAVLAGAAFLAAVPAGFAADRAATGFAGAAARAVLPDVAVRAGLAAAVPRVVFAAVAFGAAAFDGVVLDVEVFDAVVFELVVFVAPARVVFGAAVERPGLAVPAARAGLVAALRADPVARGPAALLRRVSSGVLGVRAMAASCLGFSLRCIAGQGGGASAECPRAA
ncbi:hypothetical protein [Pseudoroseomonas sp. WGS1072]|uniref:hypothetical protein n=1 Tax=Roseomonas sp. WGS1072 TaxID=3366816 RepID=UPI003BF3279F